MFNVRYERSSMNLYASGVTEVELRLCGLRSAGKGFEAQAEGVAPGYMCLGAKAEGSDTCKHFWSFFSKLGFEG